MCWLSFYKLLLWTIFAVMETPLAVFRESKNKTGKVECTKGLSSIERKQHTELHGSKQFKVVPPDQKLQHILILFWCTSGPLIETSQNFLYRWKKKINRCAIKINHSYRKRVHQVSIRCLNITTNHAKIPSPCNISLCLLLLDYDTRPVSTTMLK